MELSVAPLGGSQMWLLGAGFSKAVSPNMPTLQGLTDGVLGRLGILPIALAPYSNNLESWISQISIDQPWLSASENIANRALAVRATDAIFETILEFEEGSLSTPPEVWSLRLALEWARRSHSLMTFNYDLLVERLLALCDRRPALDDLYGISLEARRAPSSHGGMSFSAPPPSHEIPTLYKLHGSVNWRYGGLGAPATSRIFLENQSLEWESRSAEKEGRAPRFDRLYDDVVPLIVPPSGTKSPFYENASLRAQWRRAWGELQSTETLVVVGYSFPNTDDVVRRFLGTGLRRESRVHIVDRSHEVVDRVASFLPHTTEVTHTISDEPLQELAELVCGDSIEWGFLLTADEKAHYPSLRVNGKDHEVAGWGTREYGPDEFPLQLEWMHRYVNERWPNREMARMERVAMPTFLNRHEVSFAPKFGLRPGDGGANGACAACASRRPAAASAARSAAP